LPPLWHHVLIRGLACRLFRRFIAKSGGNQALAIDHKAQGRQFFVLIHNQIEPHSVTLLGMAGNGRADSSGLRSRRIGAIEWRLLDRRRRRRRNRSGRSAKFASIRRTQHDFPVIVDLQDNVRRRANDVNAQPAVSIYNPVTARSVAGRRAIFSKASEVFLERSGYRRGA
jgi:hypothetical protein